MNEHTPAPWEWLGYGGNGCYLVGKLFTNDQGVVVDQQSIAFVEIPLFSYATLTKEQALANTYLIAAAPDLLEALKECAAVCAGETMHKGGLEQALQKAVAAIKKAQPES